MMRLSHAVRARNIDQEFVYLHKTEAKIALHKRKRWYVFLKVVLSTVKLVSGMTGVNALPPAAFVYLRDARATLSHRLQMAVLLVPIWLMSVLVLVSLVQKIVSYLLGILGVIVLLLVVQANACALEMLLLSQRIMVLVAM
jgi:hypothetical protein